MEAYEALEAEVAAWAGYSPEQVVACSSGTAALHLAFEALRLPPGSNVLVPTYTMVACARAVTLAGLNPVFVDCGSGLLLDLGAVGRACTFKSERNIAALLAVHVYGRAIDMKALREATAVHNPLVIEDLAEAHGVAPYPATDAACWSFYKNKVVAGEEGGAVAFRNPAHAALARQLRCLGFTEAHDFTHIPRGHNYRLSNANATLVLRSLDHINVNLLRRRTLEREYSQCPAGWRLPPRDVPWVYDLRIPGLTPERQTAVVRALQAQGIAARHGFKPLHLQEEYRGAPLVTGAGCLAERLASEVLYLPLDPRQVAKGDCAKAVAILRELLYDRILPEGVEAAVPG